MSTGTLVIATIYFQPEIESQEPPLGAWKSCFTFQIIIVIIIISLRLFHFIDILQVQKMSRPIEK